MSRNGIYKSSISLLMCIGSILFTTYGSENIMEDEVVLFDFQGSDEVKDWFVVNDGVMGGLSQSEIVISDSNTAVFQGAVSLENNGGFSSTRTSPRSYKLDGYRGIILRLKGDGKKYQFRLRMNDRFDGIAYRYHFNTDIDTWVIIQVPFEECVPVFRGRILEDVEPIAPQDIQQIGFLLSDKQAGPFKLEIDWIKAYRN